MKVLLALDWRGVVVRSRLFRVAALALSMLAVGAAGWASVLRETGQQLREAQVLEQSALQSLAERRTELAELDGERLALQRARQMLQEARWRLDAGEGMSDLLDQLALSGHEHGLVFERVDVLAEQQPGPGYHRLPLDIQVVGHYPSLRTWVEQSLQRLRLLQVTRISLAGVDNSQGLVTAQLHLQVYRAAEALPAPASLADEPAQALVVRRPFDPFKPWSFSEPDGGLGRMPLEQLAMVGSLSRDGRHQALVQAAGRLHRVQEGQRLGRDDGRVVRIDAQQMEVRERLYIAGGWQERSRFLALVTGAQGEVMDDVETRNADTAADAVDGLEGGAIEG
ncbi:MAG: pilus assembly protein PilP [Pseudomonas farsensis]|uniref:pilus assembly protein PilP n=1 Tax=Pseudomonas farsensis TaxID=2745492 RepID=UPI003C7D17CE